MTQMGADHQDPHASTRNSGEFMNPSRVYLRHLQTVRPPPPREGEKLTKSDKDSPKSDPDPPATLPVTPRLSRVLGQMLLNGIPDLGS